jgi:hypothetical protein
MAPSVRVYCLTVPCKEGLHDLASWSVSAFGPSSSVASAASGTLVTHIWGLWSNTPPYGKYKCNHECDVKLNSNAQRVVVNRTVARAFLNEDAELLHLYHAAPVPVMQSDMLRLAVLWRRGGWYSDLDVQPRTPWDRMLRPDASVVVFTEPGSTLDGNTTRPPPCGSRRERALYRPRIAYDAFYVDRPRHPFIGHTLALLKQRAAHGRPYQGRMLRFNQASSDCDVFWFTGPDLFTVSLHTYVASAGTSAHVLVHDERVTARLVDLGKMGDYGRHQGRGQRNGSLPPSNSRPHVQVKSSQVKSSQRPHVHADRTPCAPCWADVEARLEQMALVGRLAGLSVAGVLLWRLVLRPHGELTMT